MYSLRLTCANGAVDAISAELMEAGTAGILEQADGEVTLLQAAFETNAAREELLDRLKDYAPEWRHEPATDWFAKTREAWPGRAVGDRLFLAPPWSTATTPPGRERLVHNPGLACGTGEHPCTQLALIALEKLIRPCRVVDIGTGSGILSIGALRLGASAAFGIDTDDAALSAARENFYLNNLEPALAAGSASCIADHSAGITIANIDATVLLAILDDLLRITRPGGRLILTGFPESEAAALARMFASADISAIDEWRCITASI